MRTLQEKNKDKNKLSDEMAVFIVLNTASIQIIPTTIIAIRNSLNSSNPTAVMFPIWIATICSAVSAVLAAKMIIKRR